MQALPFQLWLERSTFNLRSRVAISWVMTMGISHEDIGKALRVMTLTAALFGLVVVLPVLALRIYILGL